MKILQVISGLSSGGAQKLVEELLLIMNDNANVEVELLLLNDKYNVFDKKIKESGLKVQVIPLRKPRNPLNILFIWRVLIKGKYDLVHVHLFPTSYWTSIASKFVIKNKPFFLITEHNTHNRRRERWYFRIIDRIIYTSYDKVISISEMTNKNLIDWLKIKEKNHTKFIVIENGINVKDIKTAVPYKKNEIKSTFKDSDILLCMVGRFAKQKDQATIIKAVSKLPNNVHLLLIGEGYLKKENELLAQDINVDNRVHFLGFRDDVNRILKTVNIVILSSHWEGFGLVAVEGMAAAKPVIASEVPGLSEVVKEAGYLFSRGNSDELSQIILKLITNKNLYDNSSALCLKRADCFSIHKMANLYIEEYNQLMYEKTLNIKV